MPTFCPHCGAEVSDAESRCGRCGTSVVSLGGWLRRAFGRLFKIPGVSMGFNVVVQRPGMTPDGAAATTPLWERHVGSKEPGMQRWDAPPEDLLHEVESQLGAQGLSIPKLGFATSRREEFIFKDKSGVVRHYQTLDEMPEDVRRQIESVLPPQFRLHQ